MRTTNKKAASCVESFTDFKASNLSGVNTDKFYIVYSYGWYPLFVFCKESKQWFENMDKYSMSTTRQTSQSRPRTRDPIQRANHAFLKQMIAQGAKMKVSKFDWSIGWIWDCSKVQRNARWIEVDIAVDIWRAYRGEYV